MLFTAGLGASNSSWSTRPVYIFFLQVTCHYEFIVNLHLKKEDVTLILSDVRYPINKGGARTIRRNYN